MLDSEAKKLTLLMDIAAKAIEADMAENKRKYEASALGSAYSDWKEEQGITRHIERDSDEWKAMLAATTHEFDALLEAKDEEKNAKRRLGYAVEKYRKVFMADLLMRSGRTPVEVDE